MAEGHNLGTGYVQIVPSARGISGSITRLLNPEAKNASERSGSILGNGLVSSAAKIVGGLSIGKSLLDGIKTSIGNGSELQQNLGGVEAVFGDFSDTIEANAKDAYKNMGMSASEYMATANKMGSLFQGSGIQQQRSLKLTADAMQRAADVASVMGIDTTFAMESIAGAAKGNFTMMDNLGVAMNATTLQAYALEKGVNFKWDTASNAEKAELAMKMFMERTTQYAGNFARESKETFSGALGAMKSAAENVLGNMPLGKSIVEPLNVLASTITTFVGGNLVPMLNNIIQQVPQLFPFAAKLVESTAQGIRDNLPKIVESIKTFAANMASSFTSTLPQFVQSGISIIKSILTGITQTLPSIINAGLQVITALINGITQNSSTILTTIVQVVSQIAAAIIQNLPQIITSGVNIAIAIAQGIVDTIPKIIEAIPQIFTAIVNAAKQVDWASVGKQIMESLKKAISDGGPAVVAVMAALAAKLITSFKLTGMVSHVASVVRTVGSTVSGLADPIGLVAVAVAAAAILIIANWDKISAGAKKMGTAISKALWDADASMKQGLRSVTTSVKSIISTVQSNISASLNAIKAGISTAWNGIGSVTTSVWNEIKTAVMTPVNFIKSSISNVFNGILSTAASIWNGIKNAITKPIQDAKNVISGIVNSIKNMFNFHIELPKIKLPHFKVSPSGWKIGDLLKGSIPKLSIEWYAKAMDAGTILTKPTIFGMQDGRMLGGGDNGAEVVAGARSLSNLISRAVAKEAASGGNIQINVYGAEGQDIRELADIVMDRIETATKQKGAIFV